MAQSLYLFNPEHDMALANFTPYYKAPSEIRRMANDLSVLPAWYADEEDEALVKIDSAGRVEGWESPLYPEKVAWITGWRDADYRPWGWNPALLHRLREAGVGEGCLLSDERMERIRHLSGRQRCVDVLDGFRGMPFVCGQAVVCRSVDEVKKRVSEWGTAVLKAPWSGSGRGLARVSEAQWSPSLEGWVSRILRTQGAIMAEPFYNKVCDFAMEFRADGSGRVDFVGYSLFETDGFGNYKANLLAADAEIERRLSRYVPVEQLNAVRRELERRLSLLLAADYAGYLGVDMMICSDNGGLLIHPCVEINLRMNMGVVSHVFSVRYLHPLATGRYVVEHYSADGEAWAFHQQMSRDFPLEMQAGGIAKGYLSLTPVREDTRYQAYITVG